MKHLKKYEKYDDIENDNKIYSDLYMLKAIQNNLLIVINKHVLNNELDKKDLLKSISSIYDEISQLVIKIKNK